MNTRISNLALTAVLGLLLIGGNAQSQITQEQAENRATFINEWVNGGHRHCLVNGGSSKFCGCVAGGMRETPLVDILVAHTLLSKDVPIDGTRAVKHVEHVYRVCSRLN
jgi:hypothetical protein